MRGKRCLAVVRLWLLVLICSSGALAQATKQPDISFTVSTPSPSTHLFDVEMKVQRNESRSHVNLIMPVWTPGSYMVREFARHVQEFAAFDGSDRPLPWIKTNKNTWRIQTGGARDYRVTYRVYANELTVRTSELNADHAFWNNTTLPMYPEGGLNQPVTLNIIPYGNWKIAAGLRLHTTGGTAMSLVPSSSYLGADLEETDGTLTIKTVRAGSPAYEQGLNAKDQILALDGMRVNKDLFETLLRSKRPDTVVRVTVFRNEDLRTFEIKLGSRLNVPYRIVQLPTRTDQQKQIYESWMSQMR